MAEVTMQFKQKSSRVTCTDRQLLFVNDWIHVLRRQVILALEEEVEICGANDIEWDRAELFMGAAWLSLPDQQDLREPLYQAHPSEFMLVGGNCIENTSRRKIGELARELFAQIGPERHLLAGWRRSVQRHPGAHDRKPSSREQIVKNRFGKVRYILERH